jgi:hypothetical protein
MSIDTPSPDTKVRRKQAEVPQRIPPLVRIVLTQAARRRMRGWITAIEFEAQVARLSSEELEPRGLSVLVRHLVRGTARFIIKATATGQVWDMIEIEPNDVPIKNTWQVAPQGSNRRHLPPA